MEGMVIGDCFGGVFRGKRVLLTGHTGFKGGWLALWLMELGAEVYGYALPPDTDPNLFAVAQLEDALVSHYVGDVRDHADLRRFMLDVRPEFVFHLAAQPLVRRSYNEPRETYETNVMGTVNLLDAVRQCDSVRVCQIITSDKCYENREWVYAYRENDPMGGYDPYSCSKGCAELVVSAYRRSFFNFDNMRPDMVSVTTVRAGNVIGGGDWAEDRIIPDCVRAISQGEMIQVRNPDAVRPWQHVLEPLSGYLWLAARQRQVPGRFEGSWNFGPAGAGNVNVRKIVEQVVSAWGKGRWSSNRAADPDVPHEATFLKLDITKANSLLGWNPVLNVSAAVSETVSWYRGFYSEKNDVRSLIRDQIARYCKKAQASKQPWTMEEGEQ